MNDLNKKISSSHIIKAFYLQKKLDSISNSLNLLHSLIFFLVPLNFSVGISFGTRENLFLWIAIVIVPFFYGFLIPILMEISAKGTDLLYQSKIQVDKLITIDDYKAIANFFHSEETSLLFFDFLIEYTLKEIKYKKFIKKMTLIFILISFILLGVGFLVELKLI